MINTQQITDPNNNPSEVFLEISSGGVNFSVQLPVDVIIGLDGDKVIAESKILDGVVVY